MLHIQELLPHHSKGLQPDMYIKNASKKPFSALFLAAQPVWGLPASVRSALGRKLALLGCERGGFAQAHARYAGQAMFADRL
jgi:hypothetical protein